MLPAEAEALSLRFKALADPNRLRILSLISASRDSEVCVRDLPEPLKLSQPTVSHHLKILAEAGLLHRKKRGVWAYYSLVPAALDALASALTQKSHAEQTPITHPASFSRPTVLFVCVKNGGKSQMAAGLMRLEAGHLITVASAGTQPGRAINELSAEVLRDVGVDLSGEQPKALTEDALRAADHVVVLGSEARLPAVEGIEIEIWHTDEPSHRGIEGKQRMELVRDDIHANVRALTRRLLSTDSSSTEEQY